MELVGVPVFVTVVDAVPVTVTVVVGVPVLVPLLVGVAVPVADDVGVCDHDGDKDGIVPYPTSIEQRPLDEPTCTVDEKKYVPPDVT
jgi:hypothetical protein